MKKQSIAIAFLASLVQFYDYALFGLSATFLAKAYMPNDEESSQFLTFFATLSAATLMRPVGSLIFGYIGDFKGRAMVIKISCLIAALSTLAVGLIPATTSLTSAICMMICRMIFMMSQSGEGDGVRIYVAESVGKNKEYFCNALVTCCGQIGVLIAGSCFWLSTSGLMPEYWWRVNFVIGGLVGLGVFAARSRLQESEEFQIHRHSEQEKRDQGSVDLGFCLDSSGGKWPSSSWNTFLLATIISGCIGGIYHFHIIFFGTYITKISGQLPAAYVSFLPTIVALLYIILSPISGYLADRFNAHLQAICSIIMIATFSLLSAFVMMESSFKLGLFLCASAMMPFFSVPLQIMLKRMMPIESRLRIFSLSHSIGSLVFSSSVPLICSWIWYKTGLVYLPMFYITAMAGLLLIAIMKIRK